MKMSVRFCLLQVQNLHYQLRLRRILSVNADDDDNDDNADDDDDDVFEGHGPCVRVKGRSVQGFFASFMASKV